MPDLTTDAAIKKPSAGFNFGGQEQRSPGIFEVGHPVRNTIGMIGDALLVQSGNAPVFRGRLERQRLIDALGGFRKDPMGAIDRLSTTDPTTAIQLFRQFAQDRRSEETAEQDRAAAEQRRLSAGREQRSEDLDFRGEAIEQASRGLTRITDQESYAREIANFNNFLTDQGLEAIEAPLEFNADFVGRLRRSAIEQSQSIDDERQARSEERQRTQGEERLSQGRQRIGQAGARIGQAGERLSQGAERIGISRENLGLARTREARQQRTADRRGNRRGSRSETQAQEQTAVNPTTGETVALRNGRWVPQ